MNNLKYILQVRAGSTRLPRKMLLPFCNKQTIPEIIIKKLLDAGIDKSEIIVATTQNSIDDELVEMLSKLGCTIFRGDEQNVLKRFIDAAHIYGANSIVRICADNPFLNVSFLKNIVHIAASQEFDYVSYEMQDGTPAIKTHYGLFCEYVSASALEKILSLSDSKLDTEHVTPFIYNNYPLFSNKRIPIPMPLQTNNWLRLTIDTLDDFDVAKNLFSSIISEDYISLIETAVPYKNLMERSIKENSK